MIEDICERRIIHEDRLAKARTLLPPQIEIDGMSDLFKAMADPGRVQILMALDVQEMCVCDLAALLDVSESAASHQMRILRNMNLVKNRREGKIVYYSLDDDHVKSLIQIGHTY